MYKPNEKKCSCIRCGHVWTHKSEAQPRSCARCKSKAWNTKRIYAGKYAPSAALQRFKPTGRAAAKHSALHSKYDWFVLGISTGKDSTALLLWLLNEFKIDRNKLICTFADTGNEAPQVYEHLEKINRELHPVITLKPELDFFELAKKKKRFPDHLTRFCTEELKLKPSKEFIQTLSGKVLMLNGIRADESENRSTYKEFVSMFETFAGFDEWRPLLRWKIEQVWLIHKRYGFPRNPLYDLGFDRVGCNPCFYAQKDEIALWSELFPDKVDFIRETENNFPNRNGFYQFFPLKKTPERFRDKIIKTENSHLYDTPRTVAGIDGVIKWSKSKYVGKKWIVHETECKAGVCE